MDVAGNVEAQKSLSLTINTTPPTTTVSLSGPSGANGWYLAPVQVTLSATDPDGASEIAGTHYTVDGGSQQTYSSAFAVSGDGTHTVTYWSVDGAGNAETAHALTVKIDGTPPTLAFGSATPSANGNGWNSSPVTLPYTASDATSGVATATPDSPLTFAAEGSGQTQTVTVTDNAGNTAAFTSQAVSIDLTAPVTTASTSGVTVTLTATDNLSGVASTYYTDR